jgi:hypothetical protein
MAENPPSNAPKPNPNPAQEKDGDRQYWLTFFTSIPQGDGSVVLRPQKPVPRVTILQAAKVLGISDDGVRRLIQKGILQIERPTPHKTYVLTESLDTHLRHNARDPEFWEDRRGRATWGGGVRR